MVTFSSIFKSSSVISVMISWCIKSIWNSTCFLGAFKNATLLHFLTVCYRNQMVDRGFNSVYPLIWQSFNIWYIMSHEWSIMSSERPVLSFKDNSNHFQVTPSMDLYNNAPVTGLMYLILFARLLPSFRLVDCRHNEPIFVSKI